MFVVELEQLRKSKMRRSEWKKTAEDLRALGDACIEIADQMDGVLEEAETGQKERPKAKAG